jgi:predicted phosphoribosyltransferase
VDFKNRADAGNQLATELKKSSLVSPLVLAIPRGGVAVAAPVARKLGAELDVILVRKLRAPDSEELAIGAVCEDGTVFFNEFKDSITGVTDAYLDGEIETQRQILRERGRVICKVKPRSTCKDRSVILVDDGIATGATARAAIDVLRKSLVKEIILATPVASPEAVEALRHYVDKIVVLSTPLDFRAVGTHYEHFPQIDDAEMLHLLAQSV